MSGSEGDVLLLGLLLNFAFFMIFVSVICLILQLLGMWQTYKKLGLAPWACLVPIYTVWVLASRLVKREIAIGATVTTAVAFVLQALYTWLDQPTWVGALLGIAAIVTLVFDCIIKDKLSQAFGYTRGFTVGLVLLPFIFFMILGFGSRMPIEKAEPAALPSAGATSSEREPEEDSPFTQE